MLKETQYKDGQYYNYNTKTKNSKPKIKKVGNNRFKSGKK